MEISFQAGDTKLTLGLDRTVIGLPYPKLPPHDKQNPHSIELVADVKQKQKEFVSEMHHIISAIKSMGYYKLKRTQSKDLVRCNVQTNDGKLLCIFTLGFSFGTGVVNVEINPTRLTHQGNWSELNDMLSLIFDHHYDELYARGVVSCAEFYVDVHGELLTNLVLIDKGRRKTTQHKGTTYQGKRGSRLVGTMYNKSQQLKQEGTLTRFETRLNDRGIRFQCLVEHYQLNPFSNFIVIQRSLLQEVAKEWSYPKLTNLIIEHGIYGAIKNKPARDALLARLKEGAVPWWQPELFGTIHREILSEFKPRHSWYKPQQHWGEI